MELAKEYSIRTKKLSNILSNLNMNPWSFEIRKIKKYWIRTGIQFFCNNSSLILRTSTSYYFTLFIYELLQTHRHKRNWIQNYNKAIEFRITIKFLRNYEIRDILADSRFWIFFSLLFYIFLVGFCVLWDPHPTSSLCPCPIIAIILGLSFISISLFPFVTPSLLLPPYYHPLSL